MKYIATLLPLYFLISSVWAQQQYDYINGNVVEQLEDNSISPILGANVYWAGTTIGTTTDLEGNFSLEKAENNFMLVISYVGYQSDTINIKGKNNINVRLKSSLTLDEVQVTKRRKTTEISYIDALKVEKIGEEELLKAACCNLAESFETNPSVDVAFTDAVTGTRQIQLLGLAGTYTQITRENMPDIRGLSSLYGLIYVPGPWIESILLNKGTGSVVNGYEGIAGQINVELKKPEEADKIFLNAYVNREGHLEGNAILSNEFDDRWSGALLLHGTYNNSEHDLNDDSFLDHPLSTKLIGLNRWKYFGKNGFRMQLAVKATYLDNVAGQKKSHSISPLWKMNMVTQRYEAWGKFGKVYEDQPWKSIGLQVSGASHYQESSFGLNNYDGIQHTSYINSLYQSILGNTNNSFRTGISLQYDYYTESLNNSNYDREEIVPGAFFEYTRVNGEKFSLVAGIRADYHNLFGAFVTPRLHLRYAPNENNVIRFSGGKGQRTANIFAENSGIFATSREIVITGNESEKPYGLREEIAWNYGANYTHTFRLGYRDGSVTFDFYRTDFINQVIVDWDKNPQQINFYNLGGDSYSNSFQFQVDYELIKRLDARLAYRWYDVKSTYNGILLTKPLIASNRAFLNLAYETRDHWKFDYTVSWQGEKRIPSTLSNPQSYRLPEKSPDFFIMNAQVSKTWWERLEIYAGAENLLNYTQDNPIIASNEPFSDYFDSSLIWGPIFGRKIYFGLRYTMK